MASLLNFQSAGRVVYVGTNLVGRLEEDETSEVNIDEFGIGSATLNYTSEWGDAAISLVSAITQHPDYSFLKRKTAKITRTGGSLAKITIQFEGINPDGGSGTTRTYSVKAAMSTEPIASHPSFADWLASSTGAPILDEEERFQGFPAKLTNGEKHPLASVESFLVPSMIWEEVITKATNSFGTELADAGKIDEPSGKQPSLGGSGNWLFLGGEAQEVGEGIRIVRRWRSSGPDGWNPYIYDNSSLS